MRVYKVEYEFDEPSVCSVEVIKITDKSYIVDPNSKIKEFGGYVYVSKRLSKDEVFTSFRDAIAHIYKCANEKAEKYREKLDKSIWVAMDCIDIIDKMESGS